MPLAGFEPSIPVSERPQTYALYRAAAGIGFYCIMTYGIRILISAYFFKRSRSVAQENIDGVPSGM